MTEFKLDRWWKKILFVLGHIWLIGLIGWVVLAIAYYSYDRPKFFDKKVLYYMGWTFIIISSLVNLAELFLS